jgi:hypothetical protein
VLVLVLAAGLRRHMLAWALLRRKGLLLPLLLQPNTALQVRAAVAAQQARARQ